MSSTTVEPVKFEKITMQKQQDGSILLLGRWPRHAKITIELLAASPTIAVVDEGHIKFTVKNSWALYRLYREQDGRYLSIERVAWGDYMFR